MRWPCDARSPIENRESWADRHTLADLYRCERIIALLICKPASGLAVYERQSEVMASRREEGGEETGRRTLVIYLAAVP